MIHDPLQEILKISREIGQIQADQKNTTARMDRLEEDIQKALTDVKNSQTQLGEKLDKLIDTQSKFEGGWKALTIVGGLVVVVGSFVAWVIDKWATIKGAIL